MSKTTTTTTPVDGGADSDSAVSAAPKGRRRVSIGARLWSMALGLMLAAAGLGTGRYLWLAYEDARITDAWVKTPCEVIGATVDTTKVNQHGMPKFELLVSYRYEFEGASHVSNRVRRSPLTSTSTKKIDGLLETYPVGLETVCLVNPEFPDEAVLKPNTKAALYTMWFPGIFVVGGFGIALAGLLGRTNRG